MKVFLTGATGFVGGAIAKRLSNMPEVDLILAARDKWHGLKVNAEAHQFSALDSINYLKESLVGIDVVIHSAARAHVINEAIGNPLEEFRKVNVEGTLNLAQQAASVGVKRFIFISSLKVSGESTEFGRPFTTNDQPAPADPYSVSKFEAEQGLQNIMLTTSMEVIIVRPPLVYGPGVKANFSSLLSWVASGIPLPFGAIYNSRSLVALDNLVDFLVICLSHPAAAGQIFFVSDGEDVSTSELLRRTARAMGKKIVLLPVPMAWLEFSFFLIGKQAIIQRLCSSLQVDIEKNYRMLGWIPPLTLDQGLKKAVEGMKR